MKIKNRWQILSYLILSSFLVNQAVFAGVKQNNLKLNTYVTEWSGYSAGGYPSYPIEGSYPNGYHRTDKIANPDMVKKFANNDVVSYAFLQVWNPKAPQKTGIVIPNSWAGHLHFDDLWANLPSQIAPEYSAWNKICSHFSNQNGNPECSAIQLNGMTQQMQLFDYSKDDVGQMNNFDAYLKLGARSNIKKIISIGGANTIDNHSVSNYTFQAIFENQTTFIQSLQQWRKALAEQQLAMDGVDFDFEPPIDASGGQVAPGPDTLIDYKHLFEVVKATRAALGDAAYLSVTLTCNKDYLSYINRSVEGGWFKQIAPFVNAINLMTYDLHGPWSASGDPGAISHIMLTIPDKTILPNPDRYAINYGTKEVIDLVLSYGAPADKLQIGLASYGRGFAGVNPGSNVNYPGFDQSWSGPSQFPSEYTNQVGLLPYKFVQTMKQAFGYHTYEIKDEAGNNIASYIYNSAAKQFVGYLSPEAIKSHCDFAKSKGLQGAILWSMDTDAQNAESLTDAYHQYR